MNSDEGRSRKLRFFTLGVNWRHGCSGTTPTVDWSETIKGASTEKRSAAGDAGAFVFEPRGARSMIMVKRTPGLDVATVAHDSLKINPIKLADVDDFFALINYAYFYPFNAFAMLGASPGKPTQTAISAIANALCPVDGGSWEASPIMAKADIDAFKESRGIRKLHFSGTVGQRRLDTEPGTLGEALAGISGCVGADLDITMTLSVRRGNRGGVVQELKKAFKLADFDDAKHLTVTTDDGFGGTEILELVQHKLAASIDLPVSDGAVTEEGLVTALEGASESMEGRIRQIIDMSQG